MVSTKKTLDSLIYFCSKFKIKPGQTKELTLYDIELLLKLMNNIR